MSYTDLLWICDVQPKLSIGLSKGNSTKRSIIQLCGNLATWQAEQIHVVITEQVPDKLGHTDPEVLEASNKFRKPEIVAKSAFSGWNAALKTATQRIGTIRNLIVVGAETHICIMKTLRDLIKDELAANIQRVLLVDECVDSMDDHDRTVALREITNCLAPFVQLSCLKDITPNFLRSVTSTDRSVPKTLWIGEDSLKKMAVRVVVPQATHGGKEGLESLICLWARDMGLQPEEHTVEGDQTGIFFGHWDAKGCERISVGCSHQGAGENIIVARGSSCELAPATGEPHLLTFESLVFGVLHSAEDPLFRLCLKYVKLYKALPKP